MGIGGSIFLLALGAILAFAVDAQISGLDINIVGWVLMAAGLVGLVLTIWYWNSRRRPATVVERPVVRDDAVYPNDGRVVEQEYRETTRRPQPPQY